MKKQLSFFLMMLIPIIGWATNINVDGIYYRINSENLTAIVIGPTRYSGELVIPSTITYNEGVYKVTNIESAAFSGAKRLISVSIPNSVKSIGANAFAGCDSLRTIIIGNQLTKIEINAFGSCTKLNAVKIKDINSWLKIEFEFQDANPLTYAHDLYINDTIIKKLIIPDSVNTINKYAFYGSSITSVNLPNSLKSIGDYAFSQSKISFIQFPKSIKSISNAFNQCSELKTLTIPNTVDSIGKTSFQNCSNLKNVVIEDGNTPLFFDQQKKDGGHYSSVKNFENCPLDSIYIGRELKYAVHSPFNGFESITSVVYGDSIKTIGGTEFYECTNLKSIIFGKNIKTIGGSAFSFCKNLKSINIPNHVKKIESHAFYNCNSLESIVFENGSENISIEYKDCFSGNIKNIYLGRNVVGNYFNPFTSWIPFDLTIGRDVTLLSSGIFVECKGIKTLTIEAGNDTLKCNPITTIYNQQMPFKGTPIDSIYVDRLVVGINTEYPERTPSCPFEGVASYFKLSFGKNVNEIGNREFYYCKISRLSLPSNIKKIDPTAFEGCGTLTSVIIEDGADTLDFKRGGNFSGCPLDSVYLGRNIIYSNVSPFCYNRKSLKSLTIGSMVTELGDNDFYGCKGLTSLTLPNGLRKIGKQTFYGCEGLTTLRIPNSVSEIGEHAFDMCKGLTSVTIEDGTETLSFVASQNMTVNTFTNSPLKEIYVGRNFSFPNLSPFSTQDSLKIITIGKNVTKLYDRSFIACSILKDVLSYADTIPSAGQFAFTQDNMAKATLHVPYALYKKYRTVEPWRKFRKIVNFEGLYSLTYYVDEEVYKTDTLEQGTTITPEDDIYKEGYTFSGWSEIPEVMPDSDVTVRGSLLINQYTITYMVDGEVYATSTVDYNSYITPPTPPDKEGYAFEWEEYPERMPAHDITISGKYVSTGIESVIADGDTENAKVFTVDGKQVNTPKKGINIIKSGDGTTKKIFVK